MESETNYEFNFNFINPEKTSIGEKKLNTINKDQNINIDKIFFHGLFGGKNTSQCFKNYNNILVLRWNKLYKDGAGKEIPELLYKLYNNQFFKKRFIENDNPFILSGKSMGISSLKHCFKELCKKVREEIKNLSPEDFKIIFDKQKISLEEQFSMKNNEELKRQKAFEFFLSKLGIHIESIPRYFGPITPNVDKFTTLLEEEGMLNYLQNITISEENDIIHPLSKTKKFLVNIARHKNINPNLIINNYNKLYRTEHYKKTLNILNKYFDDEVYFELSNSKKSLQYNSYNLDFILNYNKKIDIIQKYIFTSKIFSKRKMISEFNISDYTLKKLTLIKLSLSESLINFRYMKWLFDHVINEQNIDEFITGFSNGFTELKDFNTYKEYGNIQCNLKSFITKTFDLGKFNMDNFIKLCYLELDGHNYNNINIILEQHKNNNNITILLNKIIKPFFPKLFNEIKNNHDLKNEYAEIFLCFRTSITTNETINKIKDKEIGEMEPRQIKLSKPENNNNHISINNKIENNDDYISSEENKPRVISSINKKSIKNVSQSILKNNNLEYNDTNIEQNINYEKKINESFDSLSNLSQQNITKYNSVKLQEYYNKLSNDFKLLNFYLEKFKKDRKLIISKSNKLDNNKCTKNIQKLEKYSKKRKNLIEEINKKVELNKNKNRVM